MGSSAYDVEIEGERRSEGPRRKSFRRSADFKGTLIFLAEIVGLGTIAVSAGVWMLTLMGFRLFGPGTDIPAVRAEVAAVRADVAKSSSRIDTLQAVNQPLLYMTCILFTESHPQQVPKKCDEAIRSAPGK